MPQKKIIKGTVAKLQGTDVFHLEPAERNAQRWGGWGGWREREGRRKVETHRQERRSGPGWEEGKPREVETRRGRGREEGPRGSERSL